MTLKIRSFFLALVVVVGGFAPPPVQADVPPVWQPLAAGIEYREFYLQPLNRVYVARMQRDHPGVFIESSIGRGSLVGGSETVREQAQRYDEAINYWDRQWGGRNHVVVAINGGFFDPETGVPWSGQVHSGWYARRFTDRAPSSGFVWTLDRQAFVGMCVVHPPGKQQLVLPGAGQIVEVDGINTSRPTNGLMLYTPQYDARTPAPEAGIRLWEALVELQQPLAIVPAPARVEGVVRLVELGKGGMPIPFDHVALSASGRVVAELKDALKPGDKIAISQELRHLQSGCSAPNPNSWTNAYAAVGGSFIFLSGGQLRADDDLGAVLRNPRTAVALNDRYVFFIVVDGRDRMGSLGMSMVELGVFARTYLGAVDGIALDGGGSSTMVVRGRVMNYPNREPSDPTFAATPSPGEGSGAGVEQGKVERVVANGLMMVVAQPPELSDAFEAGTRILIRETTDVNIRLGPGTNYGILTALPSGAQGVVLEHALNGVLAKGYYWWKIDFGGTVGWVNQDSLARQP